MSLEFCNSTRCRSLFTLRLLSLECHVLQPHRLKISLVLVVTLCFFRYAMATVVLLLLCFFKKVVRMCRTLCFCGLCLLDPLCLFLLYFYSTGRCVLSRFYRAAFMYNDGFKTCVLGESGYVRAVLIKCLPFAILSGLGLLLPIFAVLREVCIPSCCGSYIAFSYWRCVFSLLSKMCFSISEGLSLKVYLRKQ